MPRLSRSSSNNFRTSGKRNFRIMSTTRGFRSKKNSGPMKRPNNKRPMKLPMESIGTATRSTTPLTSQSKNTQPLRNKTVVIDPGHGGRDPGGISPINTYEKTRHSPMHNWELTHERTW